MPKDVIAPHPLADFLKGLLDRRSDNWRDLLRNEVLKPLRSLTETALARIAAGGDEDLRILLLPGIFGSQLADQSGQRGLVWINPVGITARGDLQALRRTPDGTADAEPGLRIEQDGLVPVLYEPLVLALIANFGLVVERVGYDWRRSIPALGAALAERLESIFGESSGRRVAIVAHSMGGLVAAEALRRIGGQAGRVAGVVAWGTPWLGSFEVVQVLRGESLKMKLIASLTNQDVRAVADVLQTFWGLTDLLPPGHKDLLDTALYAPGPLSNSPQGQAQLASPQNLDRRPPERTLAIVSASLPTVANITVRGGALELTRGKGDGTVTVSSATAGGMISPFFANLEHTVMPLDVAGIVRTVNQLGVWLRGVDFRSSIPIPEMPSLDLAPAADREGLLARVKKSDRSPLRLGDLLALLPL